MSTHFEAHHAGSAGISGAVPGVEIGEDELADDHYAILINSDEVSYIYGTVEELEKVVDRISKMFEKIREHAAKAAPDGA